MQGDLLFIDMWEVHQTSFFVPYIFMQLYVAIRGDLVGIVIFMRVVTTIIHFLLSICLYLLIKKYVPSTTIYHNKILGMIVAFKFYNFLPKWLINMDFSMLQLWFFTLFLILFLFAQKKDANYLYCMSGIFLACSVLVYPGMVFVYITAVIWMFAQKEPSRKKKWTQVAFLTVGCAIMAFLFLASLFSYMNLEELLQMIPKVFMDGSHQYALSDKIQLYAKQWMEVLLQSMILCIPTAAVTICVKYWEKQRKQMRSEGICFQTIWLFSCIFVFLTSFIIIVAKLCGIAWGPFRLQARYLIQFLLAFLLIYKDAKLKGNSAIRFVLWSSVGAFLGILIASNVGPISIMT